MYLVVWYKGFDRDWFIQGMDYFWLGETIDQVLKLISRIPMNCIIKIWVE